MSTDLRLLLAELVPSSYNSHQPVAAPGGCRMSTGKDVPAIPVPTAQAGCAPRLICVTGRSPECWGGGS